MWQKIWVILVILSLVLPGCQAAGAPQMAGAIKVLAVETFLGDIAQNIAGDRLKVETLLPIEVDPHAFQTTPADIRKLNSCDLLILNGAGLETFLQKAIENSNGTFEIIEASKGLEPRTAKEGEDVHPEGGNEHELDPHFWLDPINVIHYVENIRDGFIKLDPEGIATYERNASAYILRLKELDQKLESQINQIPPERRLLVTNHESLGYFADRYGFKIIGTIIPSASTNASPSAQQMAVLVDHIRQSGAPAIFLEKGANSKIARQVASEAGVKVVDNLLTHSVTKPNGVAPSYIAMMIHNVQQIVAALKE
ncbi:MAG TPA: metal ABC transporter substrate-binding protein [Anaerolineaceae bacterium]